MLIFGEKLNSSIPTTLKIYNEKDEKAIINLIKAQKEADYIDINTGLCSNEEEMMVYVANLCNKENKKIMLDSSNTNVLKNVLNTFKTNIFINSVTCTERIFELLPLIKEFNAKVIALPIKDKVPQTLKEREENALLICDIFKKENINLNNIYFDILIQPISTDPDSGKLSIDTLSLFKKMGLKTTCGLSNVSFGLPQRKVINSYFLSILMSYRLDSVICDITDMNIQKTIKITEMLTGEDECIEYVRWIKKSRENK